MNREEARRYLEVIFGRTHGLIEIRGINQDHKGHVQRSYAHDVDEALVQIARMDETPATNIFVGVATRKHADLPGNKKNLEEVGVVWIDCDFHSEEDAQQFPEAQAGFSPPPTMVVDSGGGRHLYWSLEEPFTLDEPDDIARFERLLVGMADSFPSGDKAASDATRILRVPGTTNYPDERKRKRGRVVRPCSLMWVNRVDDFF